MSCLRYKVEKSGTASDFLLVATLVQAFLPYADDLDGGQLHSLVCSQSLYDEWVKKNEVRVCDVFDWFPSLSALNGKKVMSLIN